MTPEAWKKLSDLVEKALTFQDEARLQFLNEACGEDHTLREQVMQYVEAYEENKGFLEEPAIPGFSLGDTPEMVRRIGDYRLIRLLGQGGMGEVYLAQREDSLVNHPVALKLIKAGEGSEELMETRFLIEQQILSELVHPNIARILDAGTSESGRPYFVMEYVDGLPITDYCDHHKLSINDRLNLFLQVCNAVQFAHHNLIVHRDIKPRNLLVTSTGQVKLLDFGIAKALSPWNQNVEALETKTGFKVLTPPYASPEQLTGKPITTSSDVYSLGVLLYEMLTGRRPHNMANLVEYEVVKIILEKEPPLPSDAITRQFELKVEGSTRTVTPDALSASRSTTKNLLQKKLKGELDNIVLMALRKESQRRYASASGLGDDIRRYLDGLVVNAQPDTLRYRMGKFVRRHRWSVSLATGFVSVLVIFTFITVFQSAQIKKQARQVELEKDRVELEAAKSDRVVQVLENLFQMANPARTPGGDTLRIADFLERGEGRILNGLEDEPEVQAKMKQVLGRMYRVQGNTPRSVEFLKDALAQQTALAGPEDINTILIKRDLGVSMYLSGARDSSLLLFQEVEDQLRASELDVRDELAHTLLAVVPRLPIPNVMKKNEN